MEIVCICYRWSGGSDDVSSVRTTSKGSYGILFGGDLIVWTSKNKFNGMILHVTSL
jgi:hypothetical protein